MGDPDIRHSGQTVSLGGCRPGHRGDRRAGRLRGSPAPADRQHRDCARGPGGCGGGAVAARRGPHRHHPRHHWNLVRYRGAAAAHLGPHHRRTAAHRRRRSRPRTPAVARRAGAGRRRPVVRGDRRRVVPATAFGGRRPTGVHRPAGQRARPADTAAGTARRRRVTQFRHHQRRLLPHRHRTQRAAAVPRGLAPAHPRHGGPRNHLRIRRSARRPVGGEGGHADVRLQSGWRGPDFECGVDRLPGT